VQHSLFILERLWWRKSSIRQLHKLLITRHQGAILGQLAHNLLHYVLNAKAPSIPLPEQVHRLVIKLRKVQLVSRTFDSLKDAQFFLFARRCYRLGVELLDMQIVAWFKN
jgi:hypothetical protein